jgi:flagellar motor switch protein FliN
MADESRHSLGGKENTLNRDFAEGLTSVFETASRIFPSTDETIVRFYVALVGEMGKDEFGGMIDELPVVASINLRREIGTKAALLTDAPTASALAGFVSQGTPTPKDSLSDHDLVSLYDALNPIVEALSIECEQSTGYRLGAIEDVEVVDPDSPTPMIEELFNELPDRLCRAMATVSIGNEESGKFVFILPHNLAKKMTIPRVLPADAAVSPHEAADLQKNDLGPVVSESEQAELQQDEIEAILSNTDDGSDMPSQDEIDSLLAQTKGETDIPKMEESPAPVADRPAPTEASKPQESVEQVKNIDLILDIQLKLTARLGQMEMPVSEIIKLSPGSVIDIDRFVDEPVELVVNDRPIARGDIVVVQENFGIRISEIISPKERIQSLR